MMKENWRNKKTNKNILKPNNDYAKENFKNWQNNIITIKFIKTNKKGDSMSTRKVYDVSSYRIN